MLSNVRTCMPLKASLVQRMFGLWSPNPAHFANTDSALGAPMTK